MNLENGGMKLAPAKRHRAPYDILRAQDLIRVHPDIPAKLRNTLVAIISHANKYAPYQAITAHHATIAEVMGRDPKTVSRHMEELECLGWIVRGEQSRIGQRGRFKSGRFSGRPIQLTALALRETELDMNRSDPVISQAKDKMSSRHTLTKLTTTNRQPIPPKCNDIPHDLQWLSDRMEKWGVFSLMKKATANGKRLADVISVMKAHLQKIDLKGRRLYGYLAKLVISQRCFKLDAQRLQEMTIQIEENKVWDQQVSNFKDTIAGKTLTSPDGTLRIYVERNGNSAEVYKEGRSSTMPLFTMPAITNFMKAIREGKLLMVT